VYSGDTNGEEWMLNNEEIESVNDINNLVSLSSRLLSLENDFSNGKKYCFSGMKLSVTQP
jgi:hypothetical protein